MDLEQLKKILELVREHDLSELELENEGLRLKVRKETPSQNRSMLPPGGNAGSSPHSAAGLPSDSVSKGPGSPTATARGVTAGAAGQGRSPGPTSAGSPEPTGAHAHGGVEEIGAGDVELAVVKSPIVGTFFRSTEPGAAPLVDIGSIVRKGQVLCIIEAMKLMNEIDSEYDGEIVNVYVENGQPVQYGERLFAIRVR
jgi:acetyl-CoA carboxylase biotin carboxyl carrier protein